MKKLLIESIKEPGKMNIYDNPEKHNEVYIKTVMDDAELMAEKAKRDLILPKDLFLCIYLRPDMVIKSCFDRAENKD